MISPFLFQPQHAGPGMIAIPQQHHAMMRAYGAQGRPMYMAHPMQMHHNRMQQMQSRRKSLADKKKKKVCSVSLEPYSSFRLGIFGFGRVSPSIITIMRSGYSIF